MSFFRRPTLEYTLSHLGGDSKHQLKRSLQWYDIAVLGISMAVGAGIFSVGAKVISQNAGPAAIISFLIAAVVCALAVMCYAEFASTIPVAGSAYTFSYSTVGELPAFIIGWSIICELFMACAVIVKYWSIYLCTSMRLLGLEMPSTVDIFGIKIDWTICVLIVTFTVTLILGTKMSSRIASVFVVIKIAVILFVVIAGFQFFRPENLSPFVADPQVIPTADNAFWSQSMLNFALGLQPHAFGVMGIFSGAAVIFFAFAGFDQAATAAEETINPRKNMPLGLLVGIMVVSLLYFLTAFVTAGMVPMDAYAKWNATHPESSPSLATAFEINGHNEVGAISALGAFVGLTSVILIAMLGLSRVIFAMSRDGLFPRSLSKISRHNTPHRIQILISVLIVIVATFLDVDIIAEIVNIGTLVAFIFVAFAIPFIRKRNDLQTSAIPETSDFDTNNSQINGNLPFRVPLSPFVPILSGVACIWLAFNLAITTWLFFLLWVLAGVVFYFAYSYKHSQLAKNDAWVLR